MVVVPQFTTNFGGFLCIFPFVSVKILEHLQILKMCSSDMPFERSDHQVIQRIRCTFVICSQGKLVCAGHEGQRGGEIAAGVRGQQSDQPKIDNFTALNLANLSK